MIPAIAEVKSLTHLYLGEIKGTLPHPLADYLKTLPYLRDLRPHGTKETAGAMALHRLPADEPRPIEFRKVECDTEMDMLLRFLLGSGEAKKIRRKVLRRRADPSLRPKDYARSECPLLSTILKNDFDVELYPNTLEMLPILTGRYPELDRQIRRYLAGEKSIYREEAEPKQPDE